MEIAWALRDARVTSVLIGASSIAQLEQIVGALEGMEFNPKEVKAIDQYAVDATSTCGACQPRSEVPPYELWPGSRPLYNRAGLGGRDGNSVDRTARQGRGTNLWHEDHHLAKVRVAGSNPVFRSIRPRPLKVRTIVRTWS
jgi:Aldo/keto reductase family